MNKIAMLYFIALKSHNMKVSFRLWVEDYVRGYIAPHNSYYQVCKFINKYRNFKY
jgi:hypothetical protein